MTTIDDIKLIDIRTIIDNGGYLSLVENKYDIPFDTKRIYYIYNVPNNEVRGKHAHKKNKQLLICLNGMVTVKCDDGKGGKKNFTLDSHRKGLYIPELIWDEQTYISNKDNVMLLVLSSVKYTPSDYIHDYEQFKKIKNGK